MTRRPNLIADRMGSLAAMTVFATVCLVLIGTHAGQVAATNAPPGGMSREKVKKQASMSENSKMPALQFKVKDIDGKETDLRDYYGNVILIVNVASQCGLTPQYEGLQKLYEDHKDKGFVVLGFPANEFGKQEPGTNEEIKSFCSTKFKVTFPMFSKVVVKGDGIAPLFAYLTSKESDHKHGGEIAWNFNKFMIDRTGKVVERFEPRVAPDSPKLLKAIESALDKPVPDDSPLAEKLKKDKREKSDKK